MKLSKEYLEERLKNTSVQDLAEEIADETAKQYPNQDRQATIEKYKRMLRPLAPIKEVSAQELMQDMGIHVVRIS